jgi:PKD repeat protein
MRTNNYLTVITALVICIGIILYSCNKDNEDNTNTAPTVSITSPANGASITQGSVVEISADATDSDGNISEVRIYIDNIGKSSSSSFPYNYTWNTSGVSMGSHVIKAVASDNDGASNFAEIYITITIPVSYLPVAAFNVSNSNITVGTPVNFIDQSTNNPTVWAWDFGDGSISAQQNPAHTYTTAGTYTVSLTVSNTYGSDEEIKSDYISVTDPQNYVTTIAEDFETQQNETSISLTDWMNLMVSGNRDWIGKLYSGNTTAQATAYNSSNPSNVFWLVTPLINLDVNPNEYLSFNSSQAYWTHNGLSVWLITSMDGEDIENAEKVQLSATIAGQSNANYEWVSSGQVSLSAYTGLVRIGFKYSGSALSGQTTTYRLDDVVVNHN